MIFPRNREIIERTSHAWIRTGFALMGFGFVEAWFGLFLQQLQFVQHASAGPTQGIQFGTARIAVGVVVFFSPHGITFRFVPVCIEEGLRLRAHLPRLWRFALFPAVVGLAIYLIFMHAHAY